MPCYNRSYDLKHVLAAYDQQTTQRPFEIIAIDDASTDATWDLLSTFTPMHYILRPLRQTSNQGPAAARNLGIKLASAPIIAFVGDDILPKSDFVQGHLNAHAAYPEPTIACLGKISWPTKLPQNTLMQHIDGVGAQQFSYYYLKDREAYDYRHFYTANISLKRLILDKVNHWFDLDFPYAAYEDVELSYRLAREGTVIRYIADIEGYHYHYHNIWSFALRQYHCGLMAQRLIRKHPVLIKDVLGSTHWRLLYILSHPSARYFKHDTIELEQKMLHLASFYEWKPQPFLDSLYLSLLEYFYCKGVLDGFCANLSFASMMLAAHADTYLLPIYQRFLHLAHANKISVPNGW